MALLWPRPDACFKAVGPVQAISLKILLAQWANGFVLLYFIYNLLHKCIENVVVHIRRLVPTVELMFCKHPRDWRSHENFNFKQHISSCCFYHIIFAVSVLWWQERGDSHKMVVFLSTQHSVEFHHTILENVLQDTVSETTQGNIVSFRHI